MVKQRQLAPTVGQVSDDPLVNAMVIFKFPIIMLKEGTTFIFGSWICVANAQGGFDSHLNDSFHPVIIQSGIISNTDKISDQMRRLSFDQEEIQSEDFFYLEKDLKNSHDLLSTKGEAPLDDETSDDERKSP